MRTEAENEFKFSILKQAAKIYPPVTDNKTAVYILLRARKVSRRALKLKVMHEELSKYSGL